METKDKASFQHLLVRHIIFLCVSYFFSSPNLRAEDCERNWGMDRNSHWGGLFHNYTRVCMFVCVCGCNYSYESVNKEQQYYFYYI